MKTKRQAVTQLLLSTLASGRRPVEVIRKAAKEAGISWRSLERAKAELGVVSLRHTKGNRGKGSWAWRLAKPLAPGGVTAKAVADAKPTRPPNTVTPRSNQVDAPSVIRPDAPGEDAQPDPFGTGWALLMGKRRG